MFEFELPIGGLVEILGTQYEHLGQGRFVSSGLERRPYIIEAISDIPSVENNVIPLTRRNSEMSDKRWRVVYFCATQEDIANGWRPPGTDKEDINVFCNSDIAEFKLYWRQMITGQEDSELTPVCS